MEIINLICSPLHPSFTPKAAVREIPLGSSIPNSLQCIYVNRAGSQEARDRLVQSFTDRQEAIEVRNEDFSPLSVFAEGTTTNGSLLLPFKRGAFAGMRTTTPCFYSISSGMISPTYDIISLPELMVLLVCNLSFRISRINIMPEFTPNTFMLEKHADKGNEPWKIFAWCVRDAISKHSGIIKLDEKLCLKDKNAFYALMSGHCDRAEINGQYFEYQGDEPVQEV